MITEIDNIRKEMDRVTSGMIVLLKERIELSEKMKDAKIHHKISISDPARENDMLDNVIKQSNEIDLDKDIAVRFINHIMSRSIKIQSTNNQTHLSIFYKAKALEIQGKKIIHLEVGEPDFGPPKIVKRALNDAIDGEFTKYGAATGMPTLKNTLAKYLVKKFNVPVGTNIKPDNIIISPGARFSIYGAITMLLNTGDEIIVIDPSWPAYKDCALNVGVKVKKITTTLEDNWEPQIKDIKEKINKNTKMIVLNYPNNPTGKVLDPEILDEIIKISAENDMYVLSDEIYSEYATSKWKSVLEYGYEKSITVQSFSKSHAMTGFRIGYAIAHKDIIDKMAPLWSLCLTSVAEPIQYVAMKALEEDITKNVEIINDRMKIVISEAEKIGLEFVEPDGAMYLFARPKHNTNFDGVDFANQLLNMGVAVAPGEGFGKYRNFIRISACRNKNTLIEGMHIIRDMKEVWI